MPSRKSHIQIIAVGVTAFTLSLLIKAGPAWSAQSEQSGQAVDEEYTRLIEEATTEPEFLSPLTSYLPQVDGVPTPKDVLGYIVGAPGKLTYYADILEYMNALAKATPNVEVFPIGKTPEGREMVVVAVSSGEAIKNLDDYKALIAKLADPRVVKSEEEADEIIAQAKPIYWLTGNLHSGETGAAENSMELAYRLAVDENHIPKTIRENMIVLISPSVEPDGHDKHTDWFYKYNTEVTETDQITRVPYWGRYTFHDNNRDMISVSQFETQNEINAFFEFRPIIVQDNHESIPFLHVSSGTGPYNRTYDPSVTSEWNLIAWWEVTQLTSYGMPGVWTHGFWDGWAPNYLFAVANNHNALGRFYETFGNSMERELSGGRRPSKEWYRPVPPYEKVTWSMRNNVNYQQSADMSAFYLVATKKDFFLKNFWRRGRNSYEAGLNEPPYAYVLPAGQKDPVDVAYMVNILLKQRIEVHKATSSISVEGASFPEGSYVVRMDQPYRNLALNLIGKQEYPEDAPRSYDDTGWTLGLQMDVETVAVEDKAIFQAALAPVSEPVEAEGVLVGAQATGAYIVNNGTINTLLPARLKLKGYEVLAAESSFEAGGRKFDAGSMIIPVDRAAARIHQDVSSVATELGLEVVGTAAVPTVETHEMDIPRVAIFHTWSSTQADGWVRFAFDQLEIPFAMIDKDHLREGNLANEYDVIILSTSRGGSGADIVKGIDPEHRGPLAFVRSDQFKHLGVPDSSEDITGGMGIDGVSNLQKFVEAGGVLIALHNMVRLPIDFGMVRDVGIYDASSELYNPGSLFKGDVVNEKHPIVYGYGKNPTIYRSQSGPLLTIDERKEGNVVLRFADEDDICLSGIIKSEGELKGKAAIVDLPVGKGHIVLFTFNPFWRDLSHGAYQYVFNTILNYNDLGAGISTPATDEDMEGGGSK